MKILYLPLDERPVNTRYPVMLAPQGMEVILPPREWWSYRHQPAQADRMSEWLEEQAPHADALLFSVEMLSSGGLIPSRTSTEAIAFLVQRLHHLESIREKYPHLKMFAFNVITRISRHDDNTEEPEYWAKYGTKMFKFSQLLDLHERGQGVKPELMELKETLPFQYRQDFLTRRLRNHTVNLILLQMAARNVLDLLVISSDDTSEYGLATREKQWLTQWKHHLWLSNVMMYPGADEIGSVLLARLYNQFTHKQPRIVVHYAIPQGGDIVAAFEDGAVSITVERQITALGGQIVSEHEDADIALLINPPLDPHAEWVRDYTEAEKQARLPHLNASLDWLAQQGKHGRVLAIADVAHSNGADNLFFSLLKEHDLLTQLSAFSAWNTAGNSIGTTLAHANFVWQTGKNDLFYAHRLVEDWAYQTIARQQTRAWNIAETGTHDPSEARVSATTEKIEALLKPLVDSLPIDYRIVPNSVRLPWQRTFEVDFDLDLKS
jgi:hypothetical protein